MKTNKIYLFFYKKLVLKPILNRNIQTFSSANGMKICKTSNSIKKIGHFEQMFGGKISL